MAVSIEEQSDDWLLTQFVSTCDSAAFAVLSERHGSLVWGVCRRVLGNTSEAEDAFRATFIVLVRKGDSRMKFAFKRRQPPAPD